MSQDVMARWQAFVQKVTGRFNEILNEANQGFDQLLADPNLDPYTFVNAFNAITLRCKDLGIKLGQTYTAEVSLQLGAWSDAGGKLLSDTEAWLEEQLERFHAMQNGRLVRTLWPRVEASMNKPVACQKCGGPLSRQVRHQAESAVCQSCGVVNSVSPEPLVYTYFALAPDLYAEEQTIESKIAMLRAERGGACCDELVRLAMSHWHAYVQARSSILFMADAEKQQFVQSRVEMAQRGWS